MPTDSSVTFIWPLPKKFQRISQVFGIPWSANPKKIHSGIDIPSAPGEPVFAIAPGTVIKTGELGNDPSGISWGSYAILGHGSDSYCSCYLHIDLGVTVGQKLAAGDPVGKIRDLKQSTHLHFGIWAGDRKSPVFQRGALPSKEWVGKVAPMTDPVFPNDFVDPKPFTYAFSDGTAPSIPSVPKTLFPGDLKEGMSGPEVKLLQQFLNRDAATQIAVTGAGSPGKETDSFGKLTTAAVQKFQVKHGLAKAGNAGYGLVGPKTRERLQVLYGGRQ